MEKRTIAIVLAAGLVAASCVFPYDLPETAPASTLVVEGDILVGDTATVSLSSVMPLSSYARIEFPKGEVWVEDNAGQNYYPYENFESRNFKIDLTGAPANRRYRLRVHMKDSAEHGWDSDYCSSWSEVQAAPEIVGITASTTSSNFVLSISLSGSPSGCYRWDFEEDWEYHSDYRPFYSWNLKTRSYDELPNYEYYWCWDKASSRESGIAIAKSLEGQELKYHKFYSFPRSSDRISSCYAIQVKARGVSQPCYDYLYNLQRNSNTTGDLFTPMPGDMVGNIVSMSDSTHAAVGYVEVTRVSTKREFFDASLYVDPGDPGLLFIPELNDDFPTYTSYYDLGFRPVRLDDARNMLWTELRCIDCRYKGGTKNKPSYFNTLHE